MHFDGSKMRTGLGAGVVLTSPKGDKLRDALQIHFVASNNVAEYEALVHGLWLAKELSIRRICATTTRTWWCSNAPANGTPVTPTWQATASSFSRSVGIFKDASSSTYREPTTSQLMPRLE